MVILTLLAWLALYPAAGALARELRPVSVAATPPGVALGALWSMPAFWTPVAYALVFVAVTGSHLTRGPI